MQGNRQRKRRQRSADSEPEAPFLRKRGGDVAVSKQTDRREQTENDCQCTEGVE